MDGNGGTWQFVAAAEEIDDGGISSMHLLELAPFAPQREVEVIGLPDPAHPRVHLPYLPARA